MDNAAKALIIAGGILIAVLIISVAMYMLTTFREGYSSSLDLRDSYRKEAFNATFTKNSSPSPSSVTLRGVDIYNILASVEEASTGSSSINPDIYVTSTSVINVNKDEGKYYKKKLFFMESLYNNNYKYSYEYNDAGVVNKIIIENS